MKTRLFIQIIMNNEETVLYIIYIFIYFSQRVTTPECFKTECSF